MWLDLARQVDALGVFTVADLAAFRLLVKALVLVEEISPEVPATAQARMVAAAASLLASLGLSPAPRARVQVAAPQRPAADPLAEFRPQPRAV